jgi:excisionase family DNA binding protein
MELMTTAAASEYLGVPVKTLEAWRYTGNGPRFVKLGRSVRYRPTDLHAWIEANVRQSTTEQKG